MSILIFCVLGLSSALLSLIPQISAGLKSELETPEGFDRPSLFAFDIQDEQKDAVLDFIHSKNLTPQQMSPMIRARLAQVNGIPFEKGSQNSAGLSREEENENRFRNRGFNLTYRNNLSQSEKIVQGTEFSKNNRGIPQVSIEKRFAERLKLKIGDVLTFDVQSVPVEGRIVNLRKVRWTSFQPNFFIQFEEGPLIDAPKTFLLTLPQMTFEQQNSLQREMISKFPNVSLVDVSRVVGRLSGVLNQMTLALQSMAVFTSIVGFFILFSILNLQLAYRAPDVRLLKMIGADHVRIQKMFLIESSLLCLLASMMGLGLARLLNWLLARELFDGALQFTPEIEAAIVVVFLVLALAITGLLSRRLLSQKTGLQI